MKRGVASRLVSALFLVTAATSATAQTPTVSSKPPEYWQAFVKADLDAVHQTILDAHPGVLDEQNPAFGDWAERGYREALQLQTLVFNYDSALAMVRYYTTGFLDGHLGYSDDARGKDPIVLAGFSLQREGEQYLVTMTAAAPWPVALPPLGARLLACDGRTPEAIIASDIAPFIDRRDLQRSQELRTSFMNHLFLAGRELKRCSFEVPPDGRRLDLEVRYLPLDLDRAFELISAGPRHAVHENSFDFRGGVLWVRAGNFSLKPEQAQALENVLADLNGLQATPRAIVFDVRGNAGGDSRVGHRLFEAATGGLDYSRDGLDKLPQMHALWRVSEQSLKAARWGLDRDVSLYGAGSESAKYLRDLLAQLEAAQAAEQPWVTQEEGPLLTRSEMQRRGARLKRYPDSRVLLVTDGVCASACLDMADEVLQVPGSVQVGQVTSADSLYIDVGRVRMPSGNNLIVPLKVWRNRPRGNNQPLVPDVPVKAIDDDAAVRAAVLLTLKRQ